MSPAIRPVIQDLANQAWELHQVLPLEPSIAAALVAEGLWTEAQGEAEAARRGINAARFGALVAEVRQGPTIQQAVVGLQRELIGEGDFARAMRQAKVRPEWDELMRALVEVLPPVSDLVRFGVREVYDPAQRAALDLDAERPPAFVDAAAKVGLSAESAGNYWAAHWQLPSREEGEQMLFRGEISQGQFEGLLKALDYAPTWRSKLLAIARRIPPLSDMIRFAVRDVYSPDTVSRFGLDDDFPAAFATEGAQWGMDTEHLRQYWRAHWRLPSALQGYRMLWRGEITEAELDLLLKTLDYPPFWRQRLANIARLVPGRIDLKRMLRHEIKTEAEVEAGYRRLGYSAQDAADMTAIAVAELEGGEAGAKWVDRARSNVFSRVHTEFVTRQLTEGEASSALASAGIPAAEVPRVVSLWTVERANVRTELTQAQIVKAHRKGLYTTDEALAELRERGLSAADATKRLEL